MDREVEQLVEMGATQAQARAALKQYRDVMDAAEQIFSGKFDHVVDDEQRQPEKKATRMMTPEQDAGDDEDDSGGIDEDDAMEDDGDDYVDYDSDYDTRQETAKQGASNADPYAGIFFSKDRREEVIEVEEEPETSWPLVLGKSVKVMTQGQWMKGCPEGGEQGFLFSLYSKLSNERCICPHGCGNSVQRKKSDFFALYPEFSTYIGNLRSVAQQKCARCSKDFCIVCGESITADKIHRPSASTDDNPLFHCSDLQGVILGVGLAMLEQLFTEQNQLAVPSEERNKKKRKVEPAPAAEDIDMDDDDYFTAPASRGGKKPKGGVGYAGAVKEDNSGHLEALAAQRIKDQKIGNLLREIRDYLPSLRRSGGGHSSDYLVHPTALAHLRRRFNFVSSTLLRNDSLSDMSDRSVLYFELFEWLETISNHEALASMMAMPIMVVTSIKATAKKPARKGGARERTIVYEGSSGPRELLEAIVIQAQAALKGLEGLKEQQPDPENMTEEEKRKTAEDQDKGKGKGKEKDATQTEENAKMQSFCERILATAKAIDRSLRETKGVAFVERLHASLPRIPSSSDDARVTIAGASAEETQRTYVEWATRVRFEYCDLSLPSNPGEVLNYKSVFNGEARMLANADLPKRSLAIAKELAVLTTNLPVAWDSSVFLRVDETRVDIIKALITGPEGTPYHNGCYLFDIFLGSNYNQLPPSVKYMTTNGGKFRFNPNLYADGKVCLSLLGTWSGPGWIAGKSTLLQVLISIQSMILCEEPYLNEPGWASQGGTQASNQYSANVRRMVVHTAMLGQLKNPPEPFADVIKTHFRLKAKTITKQLDYWASIDDGKAMASDGASGGQATVGGSKNGFQRDVDELKKLLLEL